MSEYFDLRCDTCGVEIGRRDLTEAVTRNGEALLRELIADAPRLVAFWLETRQFYELGAWWGPVPIEWLTEHAGHALRPISEYEARPPL